VGGTPVGPSRSSATALPSSNTVAAAKPSGDLPSLARVEREGAQGVARTLGSSGPGVPHLPVSTPSRLQRTTS
jgi:hypothetical protein